MKRSLLSLGLVSLAACGGSNENDDTDGARGNVAVAVRALELPGVTSACYDLQIANGAGEVIFAEGICSADYGNGDGMDVAYIAPCDAASNDNVATIRVAALLAADGTRLDDYVDPCGETGCAQTFNCVANEDVRVNFDLTILRDLGEGFVDLSVSTDQIFVSAKADCSYADGSPIELLSSAQGDLPTAIVALACTAGAESETWMYMNDLTVSCADGTGTVAVALAGTTQGSAPIPAYAVYQGVQSLVVDDASTEIPFWNVAVGVDPFARDCRLTGTATCSSAPLADGTTPGGAFHPVIVFDVQLTGTSGGPLVCGQNGLNDGGGVFVAYDDAPTSFTNEVAPRTSSDD